MFLTLSYWQLFMLELKTVDSIYFSFFLIFIFIQLANILGQLANTLNSNQTSSPNTNSWGTKAHIPNIFSNTESNKLNNFLLQYCLYFHANLMQFDIDIVKINFTMTYLTVMMCLDTNIFLFLLFFLI